MFGSDSSAAMRERTNQQAAQIMDLCLHLDPNTVALTDAPAVFDDLVAMWKLLGGAVVRMTGRYEEAGRWQNSGAKDFEDDLSRKTGTSRGQARRAANTSRRLKNRPKTDDALRQGKLSGEQADAVTSGADASPDEEDDLLDSAAKDPLHETKKKAARARARADKDREARRRRQHAMRGYKRWIDEDGMANHLLRTTPEISAEIDATLKPLIDREFADARDAGRMENWDAYAHDVVTDLLTGRRSNRAAAPDRPTPPPAPAGPARPTSENDSADSTDDGNVDGNGDRLPRRAGNQAVRPDRKVIGIIDVAALRRGHVEGDECCDILGVGPVPVSAVRDLIGDAALALVFKDGKDVLNVTHLAREVTAHQRTTLEARGCRCEVDGCGTTHHLEIDHVTGWTLTKTTRVDDLSWLCPHHHDRKSLEDLVLLGPPGRRRLVPRDGDARAAPATTQTSLAV